MNDTDNAVERFTEVAQKVSDKTQLSQEDAEFLLAVCATLETDLQVTHSMLMAAVRQSKDAIMSTAAFVLRKCGRNDFKIKKKISQVCEENHAMLVHSVQQHGLAISNTIQTQEDNNDTDSTIS